ncbi:MAG: DUF3857 domain-containing protein [Ignavibacteriae bacterium]|nr:DUF3857 domain-containing protein [Ignavibacteriota bacterium]
MRNKILVLSWVLHRLPTTTPARQMAMRVYTLSVFSGILLCAAITRGAFAGEHFARAKASSWTVPALIPARAVDTSKSITDGVSYLLVDDQVNLETEEFYHHYANRVETEAGLENASQLEFVIDPSYEQLTLHTLDLIRAGRRQNRLNTSKFKTLQRETSLDRRLYDGRLTVLTFLEDVRVGDIIEFSYTLKGSNPIFHGKFTRIVWLEWSQPVTHLQFRILSREERTLHFKNRSTSVKPSISVHDHLREYRWELDTIPGKPYESGVPGWFDMYAAIEISEYASWSEVAAWGSEVYAYSSGLSLPMRKKVSEWEQRFSSVDKRVTAAVRFVQDEIRYLGMEIGESSHKPSPPDQVFRRRFGDCKDKSLLLCTLLKAMGVEAFPVLVDTDLRLAVRHRLPSPTVFDHVIAGAVVNDTTYWLDATYSHQRSTLQHTFIPDYGYGLPLAPGTKELAPIVQPPNNDLLVDIAEYYSITDFEKPAELLVITKFYHQKADAARSDFADVSRPAMEKRYQGFYGTQYPEVVVSAPLRVEDIDSLNLVQTTEYYKIPHFWARMTDSTRLKAGFYAQYTRDLLHKPDVSSRLAPYGISHPTYTRHTIDIKLPEDWPTSTESKVIRDSSFTFDYSQVTNGDRIVLRYTYRTLRDAVSAADVPAYIAHIDDARDQLGYRLTYTKRTSKPDISRAIWMFVVAGVAVVLLAATILLAAILHFTAASKTISVQQVLRNSFALLRLNLPVSVGASLVMLVAIIVVEFFRPHDTAALVAMMIAANLIATAAGLVVMKASLASCEKRQETLLHFFPDVREFFTYVVATVVYFSAMLLGLVMLVVPGIILAVKLQFYSLFIIDQHMGPIESLKASFVHTRKVEASLIVLAITCAFVNIVGLLFLGIGYLIAYPFTVLCATFAYNTLLSADESGAVEGGVETVDSY